MKITPEVRALAIEQAERRCECTGARCKHGLRGDEWKVFWRSEDGGVNRDNIEAWCLDCFDNNFDVPREMISLFSLDIIDYPRLFEEDRRQAITPSLARMAQSGQIMVTGSAVPLVRVGLDLEPIDQESAKELSSVQEIWTMKL